MKVKTNSRIKILCYFQRRVVDLSDFSQFDAPPWSLSLFRPLAFLVSLVGRS